MRQLARIVLALAFGGPLCCTSALAQAQRTFVASYGSDANNCTLATPCRSFSAAQTATASGGEIVALDAAGYGAIAITKSISIIANPGVYAGISASSGNAVTIATPGVNVRLSGLQLNGIGAHFGILMTAGASLTVERCLVSGFTLNGITVTTAAKARIVDTLVTANGQTGVQISAGATADVVNVRMLGNEVGLYVSEDGASTTSAAVSNSVASQNNTGFAVMATTATGVAKLTVTNSTADHNAANGYQCVDGGVGTTTMFVSSSRATRNGWGFVQGETAVLKSAGNNAVNENTNANLGTITNVGTM